MMPSIEKDYNLRSLALDKIYFQFLEIKQPTEEVLARLLQIKNELCELLRKPTLIDTTYIQGTTKRLTDVLIPLKDIPLATKKLIATEEYNTLVNRNVEYILPELLLIKDTIEVPQKIELDIEKIIKKLTANYGSVLIAVNEVTQIIEVLERFIETEKAILIQLLLYYASSYKEKDIKLAKKLRCDANL